MKLATDFFRRLWDHRADTQAARRKLIEKDLAANKGKIEKLLDRIVDAESSSVMSRLEQRVEEMQKTELLLQEKLANFNTKQRPYNEMYRTAMQFISNPLNIWKFGGFEEKLAVQKLVFTDRLIYTRNQLYRTPKLSLPFKVLGAFVDSPII